jgi:hypothetical protein
MALRVQALAGHSNLLTTIRYYAKVKLQDAMGQAARLPDKPERRLLRDAGTHLPTISPRRGFAGGAIACLNNRDTSMIWGNYAAEYSNL